MNSNNEFFAFIAGIVGGFAITLVILIYLMNMT
jgi:hypothetical protein